MGSGFSERLRDACVAAGVESSEELATRCGLPVETVRGWIASQGETMLLRDCLTLRKVLRVRGQWLLDGAGSLGSLQNRPRIARLVRVAERMTDTKAAEWLDIGEYLARH